MKKSGTVLITNMYLQRYSGSELHTLSIAKGFQEKGYDVIIGVSSKTYPLLKETKKFQVINVLEEELPVTHFDILFLQHFPVFDYLCTKYNITYNKMIISKLGPTHPLEHLPSFANKADLVVCVSEEIREQIREDVDSSVPIMVFPNYATPEYFAGYEADKSIDKLQRIAVISNHVPKELKELKMQLELVEMDFIGEEFTPKLVDASLLKEYDLIITIGKTVQYCMAIGIPVYVYDHFGGPGYLTEDNFEHAEKHVFSGRGFAKKDVRELREDICNHYLSAVERLPWLNERARRRYNFDVLFDQALSLIGEMNEDNKPAEFYNLFEKKNINFYSSLVPVVFSVHEVCTSKVYFEFDNGFEEEKSKKWDIRYNYKIKKKLEVLAGTKQIRFDPSEEMCKCVIERVDAPMNVRVIGVNHIPNRRDMDVFLTNDAQYILELDEAVKEDCEIFITYYCEKINVLEIEDIFRNYKHTIEGLMEKNRDLNEQMNSSLFGKIKKCIKYLKKD
ncbi:hypothetical protein M2454_001050 [Aequitasia blattaphilus]|uniref:UDP-glycosyltransferase n=1 Tax=Aequitasia blattaphilus TaxID=2949332 RepID=A0ABT1E649_9FIRM|nr:hypothetical protein [Aequitasia blattaphilus]MCP1101315.1 hypothetical protein [Aequitasia blattaphilus]MCR8613955.1 hypothetical protein [Aequitasia blattaphilus]